MATLFPIHMFYNFTFLLGTRESAAIFVLICLSEAVGIALAVSMSAAVLHRKRLVDLKCHSANTLIVALVISKGDVYIFRNRWSADDRSVIGFTVCDSKQHICNCKVWGSVNGVRQYDREVLHIGFVIELHRPLVVTSEGAQDPLYCPRATMPYTLVINENGSELRSHSDVAATKRLTALMGHLPEAMPPNQQIADVLKLQPSQPSTHVVDLFVAIALKCAVHQFTSRQQAQHRCLEMVVFDESFVEGVVLTLWNPGWIERAKDTWQPLHTLLYLTNVRYTYSKYYRSVVFTLTKRSLVFENPVEMRAKPLRDVIAIWPAVQWKKIAQNCFNNCITKLSEITNRMHIKEIRKEVRCRGATDVWWNFTCLLHATVTGFDIDGPLSIIIYKCAKCNSLLATDGCCPSEHSQSGDPPRAEFTMNVQLSDCTGTLLRARMNGFNAERVLGFEPQQFQILGAAEQFELKFRFLLRHVACKLLVSKPCNGGHRASHVILDLQIRSHSSRGEVK